MQRWVTNIFILELDKVLRHYIKAKSVIYHFYLPFTNDQI